MAQVARIELGLISKPDEVAHPWGALLRQPGQPDQQLPAGTRVAEFAGQFDQHLLLLGAPGAGKTTLLLEYARDLLNQADADPDAPIPVVFHLSAWPAEQPSLVEWLADELVLRYGMSRRLAHTLVARDRLAVLLDGLDEVPVDRRGSCVAAINGFRSEHGIVPLAVCARTREYRELAERLSLGGAVEIQPLDQAQIRAWLTVAGRPLAGLRAALRERGHWLWELLDRPLLLSIAALTYSGKPARAIRTEGSVEVLLEAYVEAMLDRPRRPLASPQEQVAYANEDLVRWLAWLAWQMGPASVFSPDWMQPDSLPSRRQRWLSTTGLNWVVTLVLGLGFGLSLLVLLGDTIRLFLDRGSQLTDLLFLLLWLMSLRALGQLAQRKEVGSRIEPIESLRWSWTEARRWLIAGLRPTSGPGMASRPFFIGVANGLSIGVVVFFSIRGLGWIRALASVLVLELVFVLVLMVDKGFVLRPNLRPGVPLEGIRAAARPAKIGLVAGVLSLLVSVFIGVAVDELFISLAIGLLIGMVGLMLGLRYGGLIYLRHRLVVAMLRRDGLIPPDLVHFLEYADNHVMLHRVGGSYVFIHRLLQDYFAARAPWTRTA